MTSQLPFCPPFQLLSRDKTGRMRVNRLLDIGETNYANYGSSGISLQEMYLHKNPKLFSLSFCEWSHSPPITYSKTYQVDPPNTCGGYTNLEKGVQMDRRKQFPVGGGGLWPSFPRKIMKLRSSKMDFRHSETKSACYNVYFFHLGVSTEPPNLPVYPPGTPTLVGNWLLVPLPPGSCVNIPWKQFIDIILSHRMITYCIVLYWIKLQFIYNWRKVRVKMTIKLLVSLWILSF